MAKKNSKKPDATTRPEDMEEMAGEEVESAMAEEEAEVNEASTDNATSGQLSDIEAENEKNRLGWQRTLAEFQNYKRRIEREQAFAQQRATLKIVGDLLPIIDDFERAMANLPEKLADEPWLNGITLIQGKFVKLLSEHDVTAIDPTGQPFDPNQHQAIARDDSDEVESGHVIETLQKGYISGDHLIRPALVRVAN